MAKKKHKQTPPDEVDTAQGIVRSKAHPGFKSVAEKIAAREGMPAAQAAAILAARTRGASKAAKKNNPRLGRV